MCDESYKATHVQSIYMAGIFVGSFLFGKLADKYGRKPILCISALSKMENNIFRRKLFYKIDMHSQNIRMFYTKV